MAFGHRVYPLPCGSPLWGTLTKMSYFRQDEKMFSSVDKVGEMRRAPRYGRNVGPKTTSLRSRTQNQFLMLAVRPPVTMPIKSIVKDQSIN